MQLTVRRMTLIYLGLIAFSILCAACRWLGSLPIFLSSFACMGLLSLVGAWAACLPDHLDERTYRERSERTNYTADGH